MFLKIIGFFLGGGPPGVFIFDKLSDWFFMVWLIVVFGDFGEKAWNGPDYYCIEAEFGETICEKGNGDCTSDPFFADGNPVWIPDPIFDSAPLGF